MFNIVLYTPQIPQNTGNIARSCALTGSVLHLIEPLGFSVQDRHLKRAGLDYWNKMQVNTYTDFDDFITRNEPDRVLLFTTKSNRYYTEATYRPNDFLLFGCETTGLPDALHAQYADHRYTIPMRKAPQLRSLNLANSVNIVLYEALRQNHFAHLG